jgi:hypothetical protein
MQTRRFDFVETAVAFSYSDKCLLRFSTCLIKGPILAENLPGLCFSFEFTRHLQILMNNL